MSFAPLGFRRLAAAVLLGSMLAACGGGAPPEASPAQTAQVTQQGGLLGAASRSTDLRCLVFRSCSSGTTVTGIFDDAPTQGLTYTCQPSGRIGVTNGSGQFTCAAADATVAFSLPMPDGVAIEFGSSAVPPYDGVHVPVTQLQDGALNVGLKAAEILQALNHGNDALMDVSGVVLPDALVAQINSYIATSGTLPSGVQSDDAFLASIQAQGGAIDFTHRVTGSASSFLYASVLPHLQDTVVAISQSNPAPAQDAQGQTRLSGTMLVSGGGTLNVAGCDPIAWSASGGGVIDATIAGDISQVGQYAIAISAPGFSETVNLGAVNCPPAPPFGAQSMVVGVPPFAQNDTLAVTQAFSGHNLALATPAAVPLQCQGGAISGTDIGASNPLITMNLAVHCDFGFGPMDFSMTAKLVGAP